DESLEIDSLNQPADRLGAGVGLEGVAVLLTAVAILLLGEELLLFELRVARIDDDVVLIVDDPLERRGLHREQVPEARGRRLEEPDVHDRGGEVDVPHPLAPDSRVSDLDPAAIADDAAVLDAFVFPARAFPVPLGPEDALAEKAVLLRTVGAVVDRLRLLHLAVRPRNDVPWRREPDRHRTVVVDFLVDNVQDVAPSVARIVSPGGPVEARSTDASGARAVVSSSLRRRSPCPIVSAGARGSGRGP